MLCGLVHQRTIIIQLHCFTISCTDTVPGILISLRTNTSITRADVNICGIHTLIIPQICKHTMSLRYGILFNIKRNTTRITREILASIWQKFVGNNQRNVCRRDLWETVVQYLLTQISQHIHETLPFKWVWKTYFLCIFLIN